MKANIYLVIIISILGLEQSYAQIKSGYFPNTKAFDETYWNAVADKQKLRPSEKEEFLTFQKSLFLKSFEAPESHPIQENPTQPSQMKGYSHNHTQAGGCTNIDFETGTTAGWTLTSGFHPNSATNPPCCPTNGAVNAIMTGPGVDPYGGFPVVFPGGNFSLRLGNNGTGAQADRIRQTFFVTPANANFTYRYAVVLQDPGHVASQQPAFVIDMIDSTGNPIPCTAFSVTAAANIPGFLNSQTPGVRYKPWTNVAMDLTPVIGQNVTLRFTTYDCSLGGHFGYAYIDGFCTNFATSVSDTTCPGVNYQMCAPTGFGFYNWSGPGVNNNPNRCINVSAPGVYTCQTILVPGCPGPSFTHTLGLMPNPALSFTPSSANACAMQYSFASTSSVSAGSISGYSWSFGNFSGSTAQNPVYTFPGTGSYNVKFKATTNRGCRDSVSLPVTVYPYPALSYSPPSNCINTVVQFTNYSSIPVGSINSYTWNLGNGAQSNLIHPTNIYTVNGTFNVTLSATSDQGCVASTSNTLGIFPPPVINYSASNFCFNNNTAFTHSTSIASGTIVSYNWNFGDGASSTLSTPSHVYQAPGNYSVTFSATSNHNCVTSHTGTLTIDPNPTVNFSVNNVCLNLANNFSNTSAISPGSISSYTWNFGDGNFSNQVNPVYTYAGANNYNVTLTAISNKGCIANSTGTLNVFPLPIASFNAIPSCVNTAIQFNNNSSVATGFISSHQWNLGDGNSTLITNPLHTYSISGNYNVSLTVTSDKGCTAGAIQTLSVFPRPVLSFSYSNVCFGNSTSFLASVAVSSGSISSYNWDFGDGNTSGSQNTAHSYLNSNSYHVTFSASSDKNCNASQSQTVTIHPNPAAAFSAVNVCLNNATNFSDNSTIVSGAISSWNWSFGDGNISNFQNPVHNYTAFGTYTPTLIVISAQNCSASVSNTVVVHPLPVIVFSPPSACEGSVTQFTNTSSVAIGTITSYAWDFGDGTSSNLVNPSHFYSQPITYSVSLTAITNFGCIKTGVNTLTILPYPQGSITPINSSCINDQILINPNVSISSGFAPSYTLNFGDGNISVIQTPLNLTVPHTYTAYNTYTVFLTANSNSNCARTFSRTVQVYPKPFVNFVSNKYCYKDSMSFVNVSTIPSGHNIGSHHWFFGNGVTTSTLNHPKHKYSGPGQYTVTLTESSFPEPGLTCSLSVSKVVTVNPLPVPYFVSNSVCAGVATSFSNATSSSGVIGLSWNFNGYGSSGMVHPSFVFPSAGTFTTSLIAMNNFNCRDTITKQVMVYAAPASSFAANNACLGEPVNFINQTTAGSGGAGTYLWSIGAEGFSNSKDPSYTFSTSGVYTVGLISVSNLGCSNKFTSTVTIFPLPNVNFTANEACEGYPTFFDNKSGSIAGIDSWCWEFNNSNLCQETSMTPSPKVFPNSGTYHVRLKVKDKNQCSASKAMNVLVHANPIADFSSKPILCVGDKIVFTNLSASSDGSITGYQWDFEEDNIIDSYLKDPAYSYSVFGQYGVTLRITTQYGCTNFKSRLINVNPKAVPAFSSDKQEGCPSLCVNFKDLSYITSGSIQNTTWDFGDGTIASNISNPMHCFESGIYDLKLELKTDAGCISNYTHKAYINAYKRPEAGFKVEPEEIDEDLPHIDVRSIARDAISTRYLLSDGSNFGSENFSHQIKNLDTKVNPLLVQIVKSKDGCVDTVFQVLKIKPGFIIYFPNVFSPNADGSNDSFQGKGVGIQKYAMQIYDRWGHKVYETIDINLGWDGTAHGSEVIKQDVYTWKAQVVDIFNKTHHFVGHVTLLK